MEKCYINVNKFIMYMQVLFELVLIYYHTLLISKMSAQLIHLIFLPSIEGLTYCSCRFSFSKKSMKL